MEWYETSGRDHDVVLASSVHVARNLEGLPFPNRQTAADARTVMDEVGKILEPHGFTMSDLAELPRASAYALAEEHYITHNFIKGSLPHALFLNRPCGLSVAVGGHDHIRSGCILPGTSINDAYGAVKDIERRLDDALVFAFDPRWGYLTSHPSEGGTGMEISTQLFLPFLEEEGCLPSLNTTLCRQGVELCPLFTEGSHGYLYQLTLPSPSIKSEKVGLTTMEHILSVLCEMEREARAHITVERREIMIDQSLRASGILRYAHALPLTEFFRLWKDVRLGILFDIIQDIPLEKMTSYLIASLPAHLAIASPSELNTDGTRDRFRARKIKELFNQ